MHEIRLLILIVLLILFLVVIFLLILTFPTKVPSDSLGWIGSLKRTSGKSLFPMALGSCGHRITHQLRPINMNGRSILAVTSILLFFWRLVVVILLSVLFTLQSKVDGTLGACPRIRLSPT